MYYSYAMGVGEDILLLQAEGFEIQRDGGNYTVAFPREKCSVWESFISEHLETGYWNEYLTEYGAVFLFHLRDGIRRYVAYDFLNDEVLSLCEQLCECKLESLQQMLTGNHFYRPLLTDGKTTEDAGRIRR